MTDAKAGSREVWGRRATIAWAIVGIIVVAAAAVWGLMQIGQAVELLVLGIIIGFICSPITNWLEDRHMGRALAAFLALLVVIVVLVLVVVILGGTFMQQLVEVLRQVPSYIRTIQNSLSDFWASYGTTDNTDLQNAINSLVQTLTSAGNSLAADTARQISTGAVEGVFETLDNLVTFFLALVLAYWFAKDYPVIVRELGVIAGPERERDMTLLLAVMSRSMGGYMRGQLICSIINGAAVWAGLSLFGHPYASLLGIITFFLHFVPVIGTFVSAALATVLALFVSPWLALWTLVWMVVAANVTDNLISPLVMRSAVKIHPVLSLVGIVIGSCLGGIVGMVLAIPLTAAVRGAYVYYFETRTKRQLVSEDGALFQGTPHHDSHGNIQATFDALDDDKFFESTRLVSAPPIDAREGAEHEDPVYASDMRENSGVVNSEDPTARPDDGASSASRRGEK